MGFSIVATSQPLSAVEITFTPTSFHICHLVQPSDRGEYDPPDAIDLLIRSGRAIDAIRLDGWPIDVGYPEDCDRTEERLDELTADDDAENTDAEEATVDGYGNAQTRIDRSLPPITRFLLVVPEEIFKIRISIVGSGYVGTTVAACFADLGHDVVNIDIDESVVEAINAGDAPIHEEGLPDLIAAHAGSDGTGRLRATTDYAAVLDTDVTFLCLPTPQNDDGSIDLSIMEAGASQPGETLADAPDWHTVVVKSTVVPGSTEDAITTVLERESRKTAGEEFGVGMNPEFLREGTAVSDFLNPDKVVLGADGDRALADMHEAFDPLVETDTRTAEMIKYANNGFLAAKISLINDIGNICKELGIDAYEVADAIGLDDRISERFLQSGVGFGESCFPEDVRAIISAAEETGYDPAVLNAAIEVNNRQPERLVALLADHLDGKFEGAQIAVLGLAFKPGTDDMRNSRAIPVINNLQERGATIIAYDPVAADNALNYVDDVTYTDSAAAALDDADGAVVVTDWDEFAALDAEFDVMADPIVIDGRRIVERRDGITYEGLSW